MTDQSDVTRLGLAGESMRLAREIDVLADRLKFLEASYMALSARVREMERKAYGRHGS